MKHLKFYLVLSCMAALSLSSCMKDDDSNNQGLTMSDLAQCLNIVRGDYAGYLLYMTDLNRQTTDTLDVSWSISATDTTLYIRDFPTATFTGYLNKKDLGEAIAEQCPYWPLKCDIAFTMLDPYVEFLIGPQNMQIPVRYNGVEHKLTVLYWYNDYSFGAKDTKTNVMTLRLVIAGTFLDDDMNTNLLPNNSNPLGVNTPWLPIVISTTLTPSSQASV